MENDKKSAKKVYKKCTMTQQRADNRSENF